MIQQTLFGEIESRTLTVDRVSQALGVSTASVRNWIKAGYLVARPDRTISSQSFDAFRNNIAGVEKLTARANKSLADAHNHQALKDEILDALTRGRSTGDTQATRYEMGLSSSYRNKEGVYYTPLAIAKNFFESLPLDWSELSFCDPCCGTGNFLIAALESGIKPENISGFDTDQTAVEIAKQRVLERTRISCGQVRVSDLMDVARLDVTERPTADVIFTNPPWGKKLPKREKLALASHFSTGRSDDTSSLFFFATLRLVTNGGYLGMLLPDAFFNVATYQDARRKALSYNVLSMTDYGKPFRGLITKAKGVILKTTGSEREHTITCNSARGHHSRTASSFAMNPKSRFNFSLPAVSHDVIQQLFDKPHCTLAKRARWGLGIVTGNNNRFVRPAAAANHIAVIKGFDIHPDGLAEPSCYIPDDLSLYQQVASTDLYEAEEKLVYRFISSKLVFYCDTEQRYLLNSANLLIPAPDFPVKGAVLSRFLSSSLLNWIFASLFETHKVLRSDIECLPIFHEYLADIKDFNEDGLLDYLRIRKDSNGSYTA